MLAPALSRESRSAVYVYSIRRTRQIEQPTIHFRVKVCNARQIHPGFNLPTPDTEYPPSHYGERHLSFRCRAWRLRNQRMWRTPSVRLLFQDERATLGILTSLRKATVGRMIPLAPPEEVEGEDEEAIKLRPMGEEGGWGEETGGRAWPALGRYSSLFPAHSLCPFLCLFSLGSTGKGASSFKV